RRMSWARIPSYFHSTSHSPGSPNSRRSTSSSAPGSVLDSARIGEARKNGYGRDASDAPPPGASRPRKNSGVGRQSPIIRCATPAGSAPATSASARTTSVCDTPTRSAPVTILLSTNSSVPLSSDHHRVTSARCRAGGSPASVPSRSSDQTRSGSAAASAGSAPDSAPPSAPASANRSPSDNCSPPARLSPAGSGRAARSGVASSSSLIVSAVSPTAEYDSPISHSGTPVTSEHHSQSSFPGSSRLKRLPEMKNRAQAASAASAARKYSTSAATFASVDVVRSSRSYSLA